MRLEAYQATADFERTHWWFRARRDVFLGQVARAIDTVPYGAPRILDYGCGTGFNLAQLARYGDVTGADVALEHPGMALTIWINRLLSSARMRESYLRQTPVWLNSLLYKVTSLEGCLVGSRRLRVGAGSSIVCRLRTDSRFRPTSNSL